jgi:hypothetical protein
MKHKLLVVLAILAVACWVGTAGAFTSSLNVGNSDISGQAGPYADLTITLNANNTAHFSLSQITRSP